MHRVNDDEHGIPPRLDYGGDRTAFGLWHSMLSLRMMRLNLFRS